MPKNQRIIRIAAIVVSINLVIKTVIFIKLFFLYYLIQLTSLNVTNIIEYKKLPFVG